MFPGTNEHYRKITRVTWPTEDGVTSHIDYLYESNGFSNDFIHSSALTGYQVKENNGVFFQAYYDYNDEGYATVSGHGDRLAPDMEDSVVQLDGHSRDVTNRLGKKSTYTFAKTGNDQIVRLTAVRGISDGNCFGGNVDYIYDANANLDIVTNLDTGLITNYDFSDGKVSQVQYLQVDQNATKDRVIRYTWEGPNVQQVLHVDQLKTDYVYEHGRLKSKTETDLTTPPAGYDYKHDTTRRWTNNFTYFTGTDGERQVKQIVAFGPRNDRTTYQYNQAGVLTSLKNHLNHEFTFSDHNEFGLPEKVVDKRNNLTTTLTYTKRGWLKSLTTAAKTTRFTYHPNGLIKRMTLPNGSFIEYGYSVGGRLLQIKNHRNEIYELARTEFYRSNGPNDPGYETFVLKTLNANGQVQFEQAIRIDALSRLWQMYDVGGLNASKVLEEINYDANGNPTRVTDGVGGQVRHLFDVMNRRNKIVDQRDAVNQEVSFNHDANDEVTAVTDQNDQVTDYFYDGFGNLLREMSPNRGVIDYYYDNAGNIIGKKNANNEVVGYGYDMLNRLTTIDNPVSKDFTFQYDDTTAGNKGGGRLTKLIKRNSGDSIGWAYNYLGRIVTDKRVIDQQTYQLSYDYDAAGMLTQITYPSGRTVNYARDKGYITAVSTTRDNVTTSLVTDIHYLPYGPIARYTMGDALFTVDREYDEFYRSTLLSLQSNAINWQQLEYQYDNRGLVTQIIDRSSAALHGGDYQYDPQGRLTDASGHYGTISFTYDAVGNRETKTVNGAQETYQYASASQRLQSITGARQTAFSYTDTGHTAGAGDLRYIYDDNERLVKVTNNIALPIAHYFHNGLGQRDIKFIDQSAEQSRHYVYDLRGRLLFERDYLGNAREYIYLDEELISIIDFAMEPMPHRLPLDIEDPIDNCASSGLCASECAAGDTVIAGQLDELRAFRDNILLASTVGSRLVDTYYRVLSPSLVRWMDGSDARKALVQVGLAPVVATAWLVNRIDAVFQAILVFVMGSVMLVKVGLSSLVSHSQLLIVKKLLQLLFAAALFFSGQAWAEDRIYFVQNNHLNTPQAIYDTSQQKVWEGRYTPFGEVVETVSVIENNIRFPGQYHDRETGLYYNYFRDYDPTMGRYIQSDPIGLEGGLNTYIYANPNPVLYVDPYGQNPLIMGIAACEAINAGYTLGSYFDFLDQLDDIKDTLQSQLSTVDKRLGICSDSSEELELLRIRNSIQKQLIEIASVKSLVGNNATTSGLQGAFVCASLAAFKR